MTSKPLSMLSIETKCHLSCMGNFVLAHKNVDFFYTCWVILDPNILCFTIVKKDDYGGYAIVVEWIKIAI